jgi:excisionase family DNA binding protein
MKKETDEPIFVRVAEAARMTGLPLATVYHKFHSGQLPGVQLGTTVLLSVAGLRALERKALGESD